MFEQGAKDYPKDANALNELSWFLLTVEDKDLRDAKRALPLARRAVTLSKERNGYILDTLAEALYQVGQLEEATRRAEAAARLTPSQKDIVARAKKFRKELDAQRQPKQPKKDWY